MVRFVLYQDKLNLVTFKGGSLRKRGLADVTHERFFLGMDNGMNLQIGGTLKLLLTRGTRNFSFDVFFTRVQFGVGFHTLKNRPKIRRCR